MAEKIEKTPTKKRKKKQLTAREERFCQELVKCGNQTRAAISAGYAVAGAQQAGARLVLKVVIKRRLTELRAEIKERNDLDTDEIVRRLNAIASVKQSDVGAFDNGALVYRNLEDWSDEAKECVWLTQTKKGVGKGEDFQILTITTADKPDKLGALKELSAITGLNKDFNSSIACLKSHGLNLFQDANGKWHLEDTHFPNGN
jgi:phage terminase small subunit